MTANLRPGGLPLGLSSRNRDSTLLRATTEVFVHELTHDRDERRRFEELVLHFLPKVPIADRAYVAEALAERSDAPIAVLRVLARDVIEVGQPILARSRTLGAIDLLTIIAATGSLHHRLIARRPDLPPDVAKALRLTGDSEVITVLENAADLPTADRRPPHPSTDPTIADAFLSLSAEERLTVLAGMAESRTPSWRPKRSPLEAVLRSAFLAARMVDHARKGEVDALVAATADGAALSLDLTSRLIADPSGEPLVLLLKGLGLSISDARQVLLLANPTIGQSVDAFFRLSDLYGSIEPRIAETMLAHWQGEADIGPKGYQPMFAPMSAKREAAVAAAAAERQTAGASAPAAEQAPAVERKVAPERMTGRLFSGKRTGTFGSRRQ